MQSFREQEMKSDEPSHCIVRPVHGRSKKSVASKSEPSRSHKGVPIGG